MRKVFLFVLLLSLVLTACAAPATPAAQPTSVPATQAPQPTAVPPTQAPKPTTAPTVAPTQAPAKAVEIEFWHSLTGDFGKALEQLVVDYNKSQTAVVVKSVYKGNYQDTQKALLAALAASGAPDVAQLEVSFAYTMAAKGALKPVQDFAKDAKVGLSEKEMGAIYPGFRDANSQNGALVTMPFNTSMPVLYYNADMLEKAKINPPETWEDFAKACKDVTTKDQFGFTINTGNVWIYEAMVWQNGGDLFSKDNTKAAFNEAPGVEALKLWSDMAANGCGKMQTWDEGRTEFFNGKVAFLQDSSGSLAGMLTSVKGFKMAVTHLPWAKNKVVTIGGGSLGIFANSAKEKQAAAWDFVKYLASPASIARLCADTGYLPMTSLAVDLDPLKSMIAKNAPYAAMLKDLSYTRPRPMVNNYAEIQNQIKAALENAILKKSTPKEALDAATVETNRILGTK
jgi:sn-glycerol 3-phosphate transport system substrate-binding protein